MQLPSRFPPPSALPVPGMVALLGLKSGALFLFGPTFMADSSGYIAYADQILNGSFLDVDLTTSAIHISLARPIGYPAIIAAAKILAGSYWAWAVVIAQFAFSCAATAALFRLGRAFGLNIWICLGIAAAQATSMQFVLDQAIGSDSICASAMTLATCILCGVILKEDAPHLLRLLGAGALIAIAFLMRDVVAYLVVGFIPLVAAAAISGQPWPRAAASFLLVFLPLIVVRGGYMEWNRARVGAAVVTSVSQVPLLDALGSASQFDPSIFAGTDPIAKTGRRVFISFEIGAQLAAAYEANEILNREYGWSALKIAQEVKAAYLRAWIDHPLAMIRHTLIPLSTKQLHQVVRPMETVRDVLLWNTGSDHEFARERAVRAGDWWQIPAVIVHRLLEALSVAIFSAFFLVTPLRLVREGMTAETKAAAGFWCAYLCWAGLYAIVHLEPRYLAPVVAGSIVVGVVNIRWLVAICRRRAAKPSVSDIRLPSP